MDSNVNNPTDRDDFLKKSQFKVVVPANLDSKTSGTSSAETCFTRQVFSKKLQRFLLDYSIKVSSKNPLTDR